MLPNIVFTLALQEDRSHTQSSDPYGSKFSVDKLIHIYELSYLAFT